MTSSMLIDAVHPEETRVAVVKGNRLEEFDYETSAKRLLRGNVYLAKVTRVEPSLQAAFVEYGGGRNGFLAFSEIHPDYYQIPVADRQALIEAEAAEQSAAKAAEDARVSDVPDLNATETGNEQTGDPEETIDESLIASDDPIEVDTQTPLEEIGGSGDEENIRRKSSELLKSYKIQEVIKRRQIILVQVTKEERGNKGAALTTYISLAGRYCVLMPNTARGGGISRKITNLKDRRKLKEIVETLDIPDGMALIIRTAGSQRTKAELRRDYDYLYRLWEEIRENTLASRAPALIHEEANLIKRAIRDIYNKEIEEVLVQGDAAYRVAKKHMRMLQPSHAKRVQPYKEDSPVFNHFKVDAQLDSMLSPNVELKSGGHLVIDTTEALVAIDVNSGRSTRERNIEETALKTNLEAAVETARQLRLRDLAGLIVIDFIDMEDQRNNRAVERKFKEALRTDRARIQVGRISSFGLMEMSRQRLRPSILEASTDTCLTCGGSGFVRSTESAALIVLRAIEDEVNKARFNLLQITAPDQVTLYLLNQKRQAIQSIEANHKVTILVNADNNLIAPDYRIDKSLKSTLEESTSKQADDAERQATSKTPLSEDETSGARVKRRRRGRRGGRNKKRDVEATVKEAVTNGSEEKKEQRRSVEKTRTEKTLNSVKSNVQSKKTPQDEPKQTARRRGKRTARTSDRKVQEKTDDVSLALARSQQIETNAEKNITSTTEPNFKESHTFEKKAENKERDKSNSSSSGSAESEDLPVKRKRRGWWNRTPF